MPFFKKPYYNQYWLCGKWIFVADGFFGDNGKGKITNFLAHYLKEVVGMKVGLCVRPNGGANAGHEVLNPFGRGNREGSYIGHITPMGILQDIPCLIGPGAVLDPEHFFGTELPRFAEKGVDIEKIFVSRNTHLVLPHYPMVEQMEETLRGSGAVGTTKKAIGTTYEMRAKRSGIRVSDLLGDKNQLLEKVQLNIRLLKFFEGDDEIAQRVFQTLLSFKDRLRIMTVDEQELYLRIRERGEVGIAEMGQGTGLDNIHGSYPFVTSSLTTIPGGLAQAGLSHKDLGYGILVVKGPYWTRVGNGPFKTEFTTERADEFRQAGHEYGTTTGRPRRCGYPDMKFLQQAMRLNGADCVCLTKMDKTADQEKLAISDQFGCVRFIDGWKEADISQKSNWKDMPEAAKKYIAVFEEALPHSSEHCCRRLISLVSTGPSLEDMAIDREHFLLNPR